MMFPLMLPLVFPTSFPRLQLQTLLSIRLFLKQVLLLQFQNVASLASIKHTLFHFALK